MRMRTIRRMICVWLVLPVLALFGGCDAGRLIGQGEDDFGVSSLLETLKSGNSASISDTIRMERETRLGVIRNLRV
ncbi:hypothetical protein RAS1_32890 [Phycisphaerae bacterium RAS1]|nr:hypothetical protein RAS1_32890 [Phycisphaerae bacterium RAS1]